LVIEISLYYDARSKKHQVISEDSAPPIFRREYRRYIIICHSRELHVINLRGEVEFNWRVQTARLAFSLYVSSFHTMWLN